MGEIVGVSVCVCGGRVGGICVHVCAILYSGTEKRMTITITKEEDPKSTSEHVTFCKQKITREQTQKM